MASPDITRLRKELVDVGKDWEVSGVKAELIGDDITHLRGTIRGPKDTPYGASLQQRRGRSSDVAGVLAGWAYFSATL
jgi:ubiquitin-protein ligase